MALLAYIVAGSSMAHAARRTSGRALSSQAWMMDSIVTVGGTGRHCYDILRLKSRARGDSGMSMNDEASRPTRLDCFLCNEPCYLAGCGCRVHCSRVGISSPDKDGLSLCFNHQSAGRAASVEPYVANDATFQRNQTSCHQHHLDRVCQPLSQSTS